MHKAPVTQAPHVTSQTPHTAEGNLLFRVTWRDSVPGEQGRGTESYSRTIKGLSQLPTAGVFNVRK